MAMLFTGILFRRTERLGVDSRAAVQSMAAPDQTVRLVYNQELAKQLLETSGGSIAPVAPTSLVVIYAYGDFRTASQAVRSDDPAAKPIEVTRERCVPANKIVAFFSNPFGSIILIRLLRLHGLHLQHAPRLQRHASAGWFATRCIVQHWLLHPGWLPSLLLSDITISRLPLRL